MIRVNSDARTRVKNRKNAHSVGKPKPNKVLFKKKNFFFSPTEGTPARHVTPRELRVVSAPTTCTITVVAQQKQSVIILYTEQLYFPTDFRLGSRCHFFLFLFYRRRRSDGRRRGGCCARGNPSGEKTSIHQPDRSGPSTLDVFFSARPPWILHDLDIEPHVAQFPLKINIYTRRRRTVRGAVEFRRTRVCRNDSVHYYAGRIPGQHRVQVSITGQTNEKYNANEIYNTNEKERFWETY